MSRSLRKLSAVGVGLVAIGGALWIGTSKTDPKLADRTAQKNSRAEEPSQPAPKPQPAPSPIQLASAEVCEDGNCPRAPVDDPRLDGWNTEVFNKRAGGQLKSLEKLLAKKAPLTADDVQSIADAGFTCPPLSPRKTTLSYDHAGVKVWRAAKPETDNRYHDVAGLAAACNDLLGLWKAGDEVHTHFKLFQVNRRGVDEVFTRQYFSAFGHTDDGLLEVWALWRCHWTNPADAPPRLTRIVVEQHEHTVSTGGKWLADCTAAVLGETACYREQMLRGNEHWGARIAGLDPNGYQGVAVGDVNGDGRDDVYVCQGRGLPNRLFVQQTDGTAVDASQTAGVDFLEMSRGALLLDFDNDGDQDLAVATSAALAFLENDGRGRFTVKLTMEHARNAFSLAAADYDNDGDVDLFACRYYADALEGGIVPEPIPYHDANNGGRNVLFENRGGWRFLDVTRRTGLDADNRRFTFSAAWEDYDNDGDQDLYLANDFGKNCLYQNDGGRFVNVARAAAVEDQSFGMAAAWGDYNRDGRMDLYISNMFSSAGNRVTFQPEFKPGASNDTKQRMQYLARGNSLFSGGDAGNFQDVSESAGVMMGRWSWGSQFADINNDGNEDLLVSNGYLTRDNTGDL